MWSVLEIFAVKVESCQKSRKILDSACFWPPNFLGGEPPEFLEWGYKTTPDSDHVAKFQGDRSTDLGERAAKKNKITSRVKHKPVRNGCSGRPNNYALKSNIIITSRYVYYTSHTVAAISLNQSINQLQCPILFNKFSEPPDTSINAYSQTPQSLHVLTSHLICC